MKKKKKDKNVVGNQWTEGKKILEEQFKKQMQKFSHEDVNQIIVNSCKYRQEKSLIFSVSNVTGYMQNLWSHVYKQMEIDNQLKEQNNKYSENGQNSQQISLRETNLYELILEAANQRQNTVEDDLKIGVLKIQLKEKPKKVQNKQLEKTQAKALNESKAPANWQREFFQFVRTQKLQKERRSKMVLAQLEKRRQRQEKATEQQRGKIEEQQKERIQEKRKKQKQIADRRGNYKQLQKRHQSQYLQVQNKFYQKKQPLTQIQPDSAALKSQQLRKFEEQRLNLYKSYQKSKIDEHQTKYRSLRQKITEQRQARMQQIRSMQRIQRTRQYHSQSFAFEMPHQQYQKKKKQGHRIANQKRYRVDEYRDRVKSSFVPQVDQHKKKQLLALVQQLELARNGCYRKRTLKNGEKVLEKLELKDTKDVGLGYLQSVKQMVNRMRGRKRQQSSFEAAYAQDAQQPKPPQKPINYLQQLRQNKQKQRTSSFASPRFNITKSSTDSFQQKVKKIQNLSNKLLQKTKQQQMLLKYGKFKTSEEILSKREIIDNNYIDLVNMKLKVIEAGGGA